MFDEGSEEYELHMEELLLFANLGKITVSTEGAFGQFYSQAVGRSENGKLRNVVAEAAAAKEKLLAELSAEA